MSYRYELPTESHTSKSLEWHMNNRNSDSAMSCRATLLPLVGLWPNVMFVVSYLTDDFLKVNFVLKYSTYILNSVNFG